MIEAFKGSPYLSNNTIIKRFLFRGMFTQVNWNVVQVFTLHTQEAFYCFEQNLDSDQIEIPSLSYVSVH